MARPIIGTTEEDEQRAFALWAENQTGRWPELAFWFHPPNGEARPTKTDRKGRTYSPAAQRLKAQGTKKGVPDICLDWPVGGWHGLRIELKVPAQKFETTGGRVLRDTKAGSLSKEQRAYREHYRRAGFAYLVAFGADEAIEFATAYLDGRYLKG